MEGFGESHLDGATADLTHRISGLPGLKFATDTPPEQLSPGAFPAVAIFPGIGSARFNSHANERGNPTIIFNNTIMIDIHADRVRNGFSESIAQSKRLLFPIIAVCFRAFADNKFNGNVTNLGDTAHPGGLPVTYKFANLQWGSVETIGYRIQLDVTMEEEILL